MESSEATERRSSKEDIKMTFQPIPYVINGVKLWAVENDSCWIDRYCDTKERAQERCNQLNRNLKYRSASDESL